MYLLFDVDGTLTLPRNKIEKKMEKLLVSLKHQGHTISCVSGSDLPKLKEQLGDSLDCFDSLDCLVFFVFFTIVAAIITSKKSHNS